MAKQRSKNVKLAKEIEDLRDKLRLLKNNSRCFDNDELSELNNEEEFKKPEEVELKILGLDKQASVPSKDVTHNYS